MTSNADTRPAVLQSLGNGSWHYNFNIRKVTLEATDEEPERTGYEYDTVVVWNEPTYAKLVKAVLRERRDETAEFALVNKYNAYALGLISDESAKTEYEDYLNEVLAVKEMVRADMEAAGL